MSLWKKSNHLHQGRKKPCKVPFCCFPDTFAVLSSLLGGENQTSAFLSVTLNSVLSVSFQRINRKEAAASSSSPLAGGNTYLLMPASDQFSPLKVKCGSLATSHCQISSRNLHLLVQPQGHPRLTPGLFTLLLRAFLSRCVMGTVQSFTANSSHLGSLAGTGVMCGHPFTHQ